MNNTKAETGQVDAGKDPSKEYTPQPPGLTSDLIRYILGFTVSLAIGLAPYLGKLGIPLFEPLLKLIPTSIQDTALPLSAALMSIVAVVIQWYGHEKVSKKWLKKWFRYVLITASIFFLVLFIVHTLVVVKVYYLGGSNSETFLVGFVRPVKPPCPAEISDPECIKHLTFDPAAIESFWGSSQIRLARITLLLSYLGFMSNFGLLVGLVLLRDKLLKQKAANT